MSQYSKHKILIDIEEYNQLKKDSIPNLTILPCFVKAMVLLQNADYFSFTKITTELSKENLKLTYISVDNHTMSIGTGENELILDRRPK